MPVCAVNTCNISSSEAVARENVISFHCFPKNKTMRSRWLKFCGIAVDPERTLYICSLHFAEDSFVNNATIQKMVMPHGSSRNLLIKNAYPSIRKPPVPDSSQSDRATRYQRKKQKEVVTALLEGYEKHLLNEEQQIDQLQTPVVLSRGNSPLNSLEQLHDGQNITQPNYLAKQPEFPVSCAQIEPCVPDKPICTDSNMDILFTAIEIAERSGANCSLERANVLLECTDPIETAGDQRPCLNDISNDSGIVDVDDISKSFRNELPASSPNSTRIQRLEVQVQRLKHILESKNQRIKKLRTRIVSNNKHFLALLKTLKQKDKDVKLKEKQLVEKSGTVEQLRKACDQLNEIREKAIMDRVENTLQGVFTKNQIDLILKKKKKVISQITDIQAGIRYVCKHPQPLIQMHFKLGPRLAIDWRWRKDHCYGKRSPNAAVKYIGCVRRLLISCVCMYFRNQLSRWQ
ncbi:uncharacterized protein LOC134213610 [Armigeres subalbatus]|uniref:uncharacterized protein LOC134213610 n=1 Tax=Armigeres subalbatus TaxID=124917 RepID=UPI002ED409B2